MQEGRAYSETNLKDSFSLSLSTKTPKQISLHYFHCSVKFELELIETAFRSCHVFPSIARFFRGMKEKERRISRLIDNGHPTLLLYDDFLMIRSVKRIKDAWLKANFEKKRCSSLIRANLLNATMIECNPVLELTAIIYFAINNRMTFLSRRYVASNWNRVINRARYNRASMLNCNRWNFIAEKFVFS